jgi:uncharacterized protein (TIGR00255 family)
MLLSMTGFGKSSIVVDKQSLNIQIKSLNSKSLDLFVKLPAFLKEKEIEIRAIVGRRLERGKIDISITNDGFGGCGMHSINKQVAGFYKAEIRELMFQLDLAPPEDYVSLLLKMPNVVQSDKDSPDESEWKNIEIGIQEAIDELIRWRQSEGKALEDDISARIRNIDKMLDKVVPFESSRKEKIHAKLMNDLSSLSSDISIDKNRLEQELIYYLDRIDISEEITRAKKHCAYFLELLEENVSNGKKLTFASQEILRELNTMGVKANDVDIQILAVEMKDEIEKVREQLSNIL